jgi:hypothetical protein
MSKFNSSDLCSDFGTDVNSGTPINQELSENAPDFFDENIVLNEENLNRIKGMVDEAKNIADKLMSIAEKAADNQFG